MRKEGSITMELKPIRTGDPVISRGVTYDAAEIAAADQGQKVLRNTYLLLALTMVPTVIGAFIGMATAGVIIAHPIISTFVMLGAVIGLQFGIAANRNSALGILLLLLMTGLLGWWLGPILNFALEMRNGAALVGYAALGTGAIFLAMGVVATTTKRDFGFMGKFLFVGLITLLQRARSSRITAPNCSGVSPTGCTPRLAKRSLTCGVASAFTAAACSLATASAGMPAGPTRPVKLSISKSRRPASANVGVSGSALWRLLEATARARILPPRTFGTVELAWSNSRSTCPPARSINAAPVPL